jgi:hypothetical protein
VTSGRCALFGANPHFGNIHRYAPPKVFRQAMLPMAELEYTGIVEKLKKLGSNFAIRNQSLITFANGGVR